MNKERRAFINQISLVAAVAAFNKPALLLASVNQKNNRLNGSGQDVTVYHTNDLHGQIQPVMANKGGLSNIQMVLKQQQANGLLLDSGDFLGGKQRIAAQKEIISAMNNMGYHAAAIGNDELAFGQDYLASLIPFMSFSLVNCNYSFAGDLNNLVKPYTIICSDKFKIGITGVGHKVDGVTYSDAIKSANTTAGILKDDKKCDLVICLSHLGYSQSGDRPDDQKLASQSEHIDMIISGHNRFLVSGPIVKLNKLKHEVIISLAGHHGLMVGKTVFSFAMNKQKSSIRSKNLIAGETDGKNFSESFTELLKNEKLLTAV